MLLEVLIRGAVVLRGLLVGATLMFGAWLAKRLVLRFEAAQFRHLMDGVLVLAGAVLLAGALMRG